jgi:hypothetical protein
MPEWILININTREIEKTFVGCFFSMHEISFRIGSGRVTFDNSSSFLHAVSTAFGKLNVRII